MRGILHKKCFVVRELDQNKFGNNQISIGLEFDKEVVTFANVKINDNMLKVSELLKKGNRFYGVFSINKIASYMKDDLPKLKLNLTLLSLEFPERSGFNPEDNKPKEEYSFNVGDLKQSDIPPF